MVPFRITISHLKKSYGSLMVLRDLSLSFQSGHIYCIMGPSGSGKTTLFRILLGLECADSGQIKWDWNAKNGTHSESSAGTLTAVFQEDRLCETFSPLDNLMLVAPRGFTRADARRELLCLLPEECLSRPSYTLSGGMKRRTAIVRAMTAPSDGILMDEPFTGLDGDSRLHAISYIRSRLNSRLLLVSTHQEEEAALLDALILRPFDHKL